MSNSKPGAKASSITIQRRRGIAGVSIFGGACLLAIAGIIVLRVVTLEPETAQAKATENSIPHSPSVVEDDIRIATLLPFAADQLIALGVQPVCVPKLRGLAPAEWDGIPSVQLDHSAGPNLEQLIAVNPDFIITGSVYAQFMPQIEEITQSKVILMDVDSVDSVFDHIRMLGQISERIPESESLAARMDTTLSASVIPQKEEQVNVLAIFGTPHSFYAFLPDSYLGDLVQRSGGQMGPLGLQSHKVYRGLAPLSMEMVVQFDPDLLLVLFHGPEQSSRAMFEGDPLWGALRAVGEGRMHFLKDDLYAMRPGSNVKEAFDEIHGYVKGVSNTQP